MVAVDLIITFEPIKLVVTDINPNLSTELETFAPVLTNGAFDNDTVINEANADAMAHFDILPVSFGGEKAEKNIVLKIPYNG